MSKGILLVNLGSPDSPSVPDVRRYLREFLMDGRVLDVNWFVRFCVVNFAILPTRPKQSAHAYQTIWTKEGSPLVVTSKKVREKLQARVNVPKTTSNRTGRIFNSRLETAKDMKLLSPVQGRLMAAKRR